jgi:hypothetical protein
MGAHFDGSACKLYLDRFVHDAGDPSDPVERVLLEQVAINSAGSYISATASIRRWISCVCM